jgi:hypothetical protein
MVWPTVLAGSARRSPHISAEPAAFWFVHLSDARRLKQAPFCDAVLIIEKNFNKKLSPPTTFQSLAD